MFLKLARRKLGQCCVFLICSMVVLVCTAILSQVTIFHTSSDSSQLAVFNQVQFPIQQVYSPVTCPICEICSASASTPKYIDAEVPTIQGEDKEISHSKEDDVALINCSIMSMKNITCLKREEEVFMPVSFINPFFEVYGDITDTNAIARYQFRYSYGNLFPLQDPYHPGGVFNNFDHYNVEQRSRVLCVTAAEGVPLTNQWRADGYFYTITVAQFGLSHHAKGLTQGTPEPKVLTSSGSVQGGDWVHEDKASILERRTIVMGGGHLQNVLFFSSPSSVEQKRFTTIRLLRSKNSSVCLDVLLNGTGEIIVTIVKKDGTLGYVHFDGRPRVWDTPSNGHVYYGMDTENTSKWVRLVRDISIDWNKAYSKTSIRSPSAFDHIANITLMGSGYLDNFTIAPSHHMQQLIKAADWLVSNQDSKGGWPIDFEIKTGPIHLDPGWYSAMGQGQAMSTLVRAYNITRRLHYLEIAVKALGLFTISSKDGGVRTKYMESLDWYEEYPTTPYGTFVLNGFIFSLLGIYDVMVTVQGEGHLLAKALWDSGLKSLKTMLGMFDSGTGTFYDLRHVVYHDQPNRARWDYHMVHIQLVQQMAIIDGDPIFNATALRWIQYSQGKRAKHN